MSRFMLLQSFDNKKAVEPLIVSTKSLFERCGLSYEVSFDMASDGGYWAGLANSDLFAYANAKNMALSEAKGATLLALNQKSYDGVLRAREMLSGDAKLLDRVQLALRGIGLEYHPNSRIALFDDLLGAHQEKVAEGSLSGLAIALCGKADSHCMQMLLKSGVRLSLVQKATDYYRLVDFDKKLATKGAAQDYFACVDSGVDCIATDCVDTFALFDLHIKALNKASKRDRADTPTLYLSQLLLLAMGERDANKIGFSHHTVRPSFV